MKLQNYLFIVILKIYHLKMDYIFITKMVKNLNMHRMVELSEWEIIQKQLMA